VYLNMNECRVQIVFHFELSVSQSQLDTISLTVSCERVLGDRGWGLIFLFIDILTTDFVPSDKVGTKYQSEQVN